MELFERVKRKPRAVSLTSLIDIIFLLVVFFLLTSKFVTSEIIDLSISKVEEGDSSVVEDEAILVFLTEGEKFVLSDVEYDLVELQPKLSELIKKNKDKNIVIVSREGVTVQEVVTAMDAIKLSGGYNISLANEG